jgi:hypothetical protein
MRQRLRTRKRNAHGKAFANMQAAFALHAGYYNRARPHARLSGKTPAMVLGAADRAWTIGDLIALLEADGRSKIGKPANRRGPYRTRKDP